MSTPADPLGPAAPAPAPLPRRELRRRQRAAAHGTEPVDRFNRVALTILGLALIAAGALGLAAATDAVSWRSPGHIYRDIADNAADRPLAWAAAAVAFGLVLVALGLWWAWKQVAPRAEGGRLSTAVVDHTSRGRTTVEPTALARAAAADLNRVDGVTRARVRVVSLHPVPDLIAWLDLRIDADIAAVQAALEPPLGRVAHALGTPSIECDLRLRFGTQRAPRAI